MKKIIFFIILFLTTINNVYANTVTLVKERIDDVYTHYFDKERQVVRYLYANRITFENTTAYCIELGKEISSNIYTYTTSFEEYGINKEDLEYLKLVTYYGYDYENHNTDKYYMATQEIIWNKMCDTNTNWVIDMDSANKIDITKEKEEILDLVRNHYKKPSFDNKEIDFIKGNELVIEDTNYVLSKFISEDENVIIDGNKLIVKENFSGEKIVLKKQSTNKKQLLLYTSGSSQKMISAGTVEEVTSTLKINQTGGTLEINKLDKETKSNKPQGEASLVGAIYELYDINKNLIGTLTTGKKDKIEKLSIGRYILKEKTPSKGYLLDESTYNIEITKNNLNVKLDVYEEVIKRKVEIFKVLAEDATGELTPESNINFEIYDKNNKYISTITTDSEGYASVILPYGTYTFKQINSTENYYKVENFNVNITEYDERPIYKLLSDSQIKAKVKIIKKDMNTKENIINSNIKFKIFDVKNNKYLSLKISYPENKITEEFQIDKNGIFITPIALSPGKYIIEEVPNTMHGYLYNNQKIAFTIGESSNFISEENELYLEIPFYNKRVKGAVNIIKYGEEIVYKDNTYHYKEIPLENVTFHLYAKEDIYENNKLIYKKDELVKELTTDKEGKITEGNLPLGKYYIKEISTSNNHTLDKTIYDIDLSYKDDTTEIVTTTIKIKNYLPKGKLTINKLETNTTKTIPNTLIEVRNKDNEIVHVGYTNEQGQIILEDIPYGEYYLSEVSSSTGYRILEDKITFEINKEEETINIYNERIKVPNTGFTITPINIFVISVILISFIFLIFFSKKRIILLSLITIIPIGITYFIINIYKYYQDYQNNEKSVSAYINKEIEAVPEEKYKYNAILEIPSINIKRGILNIENEYNKAKYNIELIKEEENTIILAAHNGNNKNSFFGNLHNIELGAQIKYYKDGKIYTYIYSETYDIPKNGYAEIYKKEDIKSIILITCKNNTDDAQTVYIGYLKEITTY